ncbi:PTS sugar transporter subunit IIB [Listeria monocytogenes]|uniref:PTS sugar transporter subunit IIB n=1 Tax=Listeria welshimeri TaxID=1643 RepID=UPI001888E7EA|nr:PTS sugar transporter subunit IIB [Listeria welshimeri]EHZ7829002.1 PTS sugar transporter subunit IIB [Listeria monocytogenes]EII3172472.1 PTS sugar transporter subunit IIB [Listeria monocytogenes]EII3175382.1 PTS sugar transporter subunit IIB [Listeria monocytogenes]MBF2455314.1 PTS sugar transporter subunit IIB [Listeria welshimeri]MBF2569175.1 PTS sugar transporter subunit IIB [Listeria welshimeri]
MKNIMLVCNAGMSTGMLAKKIEAASGNILNVTAYSESEYTDYLDGVDLVLIGPQIRFLMPQIKQAVSVPVHAISPVKYGIMDGKGVYEDIQKLIGG